MRFVAAFGVLIAGLAGCGQAPAEPEAEASPPLVRRLTESQYRATIADIFGQDIPIVGRFERGLRIDGLTAVGTSSAGMSPVSVEQYDASALGVAGAVVGEKHRDKLVPCEPKAKGFDEACAREFVNLYGRRLFRRPITAEEEARFLGAAREGAVRLGDFYGGLELALAGMMISPEFLLRIDSAEPDPRRKGAVRLDGYSMATRLAYFLTGSTPDEELMQAAKAGELFTDKGLERQVDRLIASPRFEGAVRAFFEDMLEFDAFSDASKDAVIYPAYNSDVAKDAQEQTLRTIVNHLLKDGGDYRDLFTTRKTEVTRSLGIIYKLPVATRGGWESMEFPAETGRAGLLTHASFLALHSHPGRSSATLRGLAIREIFLCQHVPDPPPDVDFSVVQDPSNKAMPTARDRLVAHQTQPACIGCHEITDPIGLTLEKFDGVGAFRTHENDAPIDVSGSFDGAEFASADGLGRALRDHPETPRCFVEKVYRSAVGRDTTEEERSFMAWLNGTFAENGYRAPDLMRAIATSRAFYAVGVPDDKAVTAQANEHGEPS